MNTVIQNLSDEDAIHILAYVIKNEFEASEAQEEFDSDFKDTMSKELNIKASGKAVSDGYMARNALDLLARDEKLKVIILNQAQKPRDHQFAIGGETILLTGAVLMVLKTGFDFGRDKDGKWYFRMKSKAMDKGTLKEFAKKLLSWIPKGPFK